MTDQWQIHYFTKYITSTLLDIYKKSIRGFELVKQPSYVITIQDGRLHDFKGLT